MRLSEYYLGDARLILIPIEHLATGGMSRDFAAFLRDSGRWDDARTALFDDAFSRYWSRSSDLAARTRTWPAPRLRHVAIVDEPLSVRPYVSLLNTSAWMLYATDFDPAVSDAELAAYLFIHGDRMTLTGEVASAVLHSAAYWIERGEDECAAFTAAAARSTRPDAAALRALADALPWVRQLAHQTLRPAVSAGHREIPGTGLQVPFGIVEEPPRLVERVAAAAQAALASYRAAWRHDGRAAIHRLCEWLRVESPPLLVTSQNGRIVWDPSTPDRIGAVRGELRVADRAALESIDADLRLIERHTRTFLNSVVEPDTLPRPAAETEQSGYSYMHRDRALIAYNLREPGMERLQGPALPFARAMVGARTAHEWAHLAADAGWVPLVVPAARFAERERALAAEIDDAIAAASPSVRELTAGDLRELASGAPSAGVALTGILLARISDLQSNLVAMRFLDEAERQTYVRHNIRTLRGEYEPARLWRMLIRYVYEYQYLRFAELADPRTFFVRSTWFDTDFIDTGTVTMERFERLAGAVAELFACYAVDESRFRATPA